MLIEMRSKDGARILAGPEQVELLKAGGATVVGEDTAPPVVDRAAEIMAKAGKDLRTVSRDDLVAVARLFDLDPPDRANKREVYDLITECAERNAEEIAHG